MSSIYVLVEEWFYSANIGGIIGDSFLEGNCAVVVCLCDWERNHEFYFVLRVFLRPD